MCSTSGRRAPMRLRISRTLVKTARRTSCASPVRRRGAAGSLPSDPSAGNTCASCPISEGSSAATSGGGCSERKRLSASTISSNALYGTDSRS